MKINDKSLILRIYPIQWLQFCSIKRGQNFLPHWKWFQLWLLSRFYAEIMGFWYQQKYTVSVCVCTCVCIEECAGHVFFSWAVSQCCRGSAGLHSPLMSICLPILHAVLLSFRKALLTDLFTLPGSFCVIVPAFLYSFNRTSWKLQNH